MQTYPSHLTMPRRMHRGNNAGRERSRRRSVSAQALSGLELAPGGPVAIIADANRRVRRSCSPRQAPTSYPCIPLPCTSPDPASTAPLQGRRRRRPRPRALRPALLPPHPPRPPRGGLLPRRPPGAPSLPLCNRPAPPFPPLHETRRRTRSPSPPLEPPPRIPRTPARALARQPPPPLRADPTMPTPPPPLTGARPQRARVRGQGPRRPRPRRHRQQPGLLRDGVHHAPQEGARRRAPTTHLSPLLSSRPPRVMRHSPPPARPLSCPLPCPPGVHPGHPQPPAGGGGVGRHRRRPRRPLQRHGRARA